MRLLRVLIITALCLCSQIGIAEEHSVTKQVSALSNSNYETQLIDSIDRISKNELDKAITQLEQLIRIKPDFRLAQLIYGDLLMAKSRPITDFGNQYAASYQQILAMREEAVKRLQHARKILPVDKIPANLIKLSSKQQHVIIVDMQAARLYLFKNNRGIPERLHDFYISIGKKGFEKYLEGDQRTPKGVYFITSYIEPSRLSDLYGAGAFPINYPNIWDQRNQRTGSGIWLHGTPSSTYSRPPKDSNGCIVLTNQDFDFIASFIDVGQTPVILTDAIEWIDRKLWEKKKQNYYTLLHQWRKDWESRDAMRYLSHYSRHFQGLGNDYESWSSYKKRVNPSKSFIKVGIEGTSIFEYPGDKEIIVMTFTQNYRSNNFHREFQKRQYWIKEADGQWRILYEDNVS